MKSPPTEALLGHATIPTCWTSGTDQHATWPSWLVDTTPRTATPSECHRTQRSGSKLSVLLISFFFFFFFFNKSWATVYSALYQSTRGGHGLRTGYIRRFTRRTDHALQSAGKKGFTDCVITRAIVFLLFCVNFWLLLCIGRPTSRVTMPAALVTDRLAPDASYDRLH